MNEVIATVLSSLKVGKFGSSISFVICPSILLVSIVVIDLPRFLFIYTSSERRAETGLSFDGFSKLIVILCLVTIATFLADALLVAVRIIVSDFWMSTYFAWYVGLSWLAWTISMFALLDETKRYHRWYWTQYFFWTLVVFNETIIGWTWLKSVLRPEPGTLFTIYEKILLGIFTTRYIVEIMILVLSMIHLFSSPIDNGNVESSSLLGATATANRYGATNTKTVKKSVEKERGAFDDFYVKMKKLLPFIWPHHNIKLQVYVLLCFVLMSFGFVANLMAPRQIGIVVDNLKQGQFSYTPILIYIGLRFLQGGSGLLQTLQNWLWIPIGQYTTKSISVKLFSHLHSLSLDFHIKRKTGEVLQIMDRGTLSVVSLLNYILFQIFPVWVNIFLISFFTTYIYAPSFGLIVFMTMALYLYATISITEWRTKYKRATIELDNYARTKAVDALLNFETVKYYNAEDFEVNRYRDAIIECQAADWKSSVSLNMLNLAQNSIITGGLLSGCLLFAHEVSKGQLSAGDFVAFNMYMIQLYTPLHWFGTYYRMIQSNFIDMEKMFTLLDVVQTVQDVPDAKELTVTQGNVVFENVTFSYDERQTALNGISFTIPKGSTVALVGPSGGGKSTILKLLFRFYDCRSGHIYIDGQDIRKVTQLSLRRNIGVVPQDTVLFNDTIYYNIQYGDMQAKDEEIKRAAKAAQIHHKIEAFPDGYQTRVGERGLRLSGGEKQRVAIARTILKNPPIILLDEATSALDTTTERHIQQALSDMTKDRTTLVIAHRLSTIVNADLILVIKDGKVVEKGSHEELIKDRTEKDSGVYYEMWQKQLHDEGLFTPDEISLNEADQTTGSKPVFERSRTDTIEVEDNEPKKATAVSAKELETLELEVEELVEEEGSQAQHTVETLDLEEE